MAKRKECKPTIRLSIKKETFEETKKILESINLTIGQVIVMLCNQIVLHRKLPFELKAKESIQNDESGFHHINDRKEERK